MREVRSMNRAGRYNQVLMAFALQIERGLGDEMTAYDIARKIDLRPTSPNFRDILSEMVRDQKLKARWIDSKKGGGVRGATVLYSPAGKIMPKKREIVVKAKGKQVGQLELF